MSVLRKTLRFRGAKGEAQLPALFDSGATYSCIRRDAAEALANLEALPEPMMFRTAAQGGSLRAEFAVLLHFYLGEYRFSDEFMVFENLSSDVIIGAKTLQSWRMKLDFDHDEVIFDPAVTELQII